MTRQSRLAVNDTAHQRGGARHTAISFSGFARDRVSISSPEVSDSERFAASAPVEPRHVGAFWDKLSNGSDPLFVKSNEVGGEIKQNTLIQAPALFKAKDFSGRSVNTLQEWEGLVESVGDKSFTARLRDLTDRSRGEEFADIPFDEVDPSDMARVVTGAVFHLIIGFSKRNGSRRRETFIYFRKFLPRGKSKANTVVDLLNGLMGDVD